MHELIQLYQWAMYGGLLALTATCVLVLFLKKAHEEAREAARPKLRRADRRIPYLRPTANR